MCAVLVRSDDFIARIGKIRLGANLVHSRWSYSRTNIIFNLIFSLV